MFIRYVQCCDAGHGSSHDEKVKKFLCQKVGTNIPVSLVPQMAALLSSSEDGTRDNSFVTSLSKVGANSKTNMVRDFVRMAMGSLNLELPLYNVKLKLKIAASCNCMA